MAPKGLGEGTALRGRCAGHPDDEMKQVVPLFCSLVPGLCIHLYFLKRLAWTPTTQAEPSPPGAALQQACVAVPSHTLCVRPAARQCPELVARSQEPRASAGSPAWARGSMLWVSCLWVAGCLSPS